MPISKMVCVYVIYSIFLIGACVCLPRLELTYEDCVKKSTVITYNFKKVECLMHNIELTCVNMSLSISM